MRRARTILAILIGLAVLHGAVWFFVARAVRDRIDGAVAVAVAGATGIDLKIQLHALAGYPFAAGVAWSGVEAGPAGLPLGSRLATDRMVLALTLLPPWSLRVDLPDPVRLTTPDGATRTFGAADARITAPCCHPTEFALAGTAAVLSVGSAPVARIAQLTGTLRPSDRTIAISTAGIELMSGGAPLAPRVATASATLTLEGPPPPMALASGQAGIDALIAWRDGGGAIELGHAAIGWGPVDVEGDGRFTLDPLLQPAATGQAENRGRQRSARCVKRRRIAGTARGAGGARGAWPVAGRRNTGRAGTATGGSGADHAGQWPDQPRRVPGAAHCALDAALGRLAGRAVPDPHAGHRRSGGAVEAGQVRKHRRGRTSIRTADRPAPAIKHPATRRSRGPSASPAPKTKKGHSFEWPRLDQATLPQLWIRPPP